MNKLVVLMLVVAVTLSSPLAAFERVKADNFAKADFVFPDDIDGDGINLLFLGIATGQDNGTWQGEELVRWHRALIDADALTAGTRAWHFAVMESPPFFVKGVIRRAIAKSYVGLMPPEQGAVLFIDDLQSFAEAAGLPVDGQPTIVAWQADQGVLATWRGEVNEAGLASIDALLNPESANSGHGAEELPSKVEDGRL